jgi:hypothetical protein
MAAMVTGPKTENTALRSLGSASNGRSLSREIEVEVETE